MKDSNNAGFPAPLDPEFQPAIVFQNQYLAAAKKSGRAVPLVIGLERENRLVSRYETLVLPEADPVTLQYAERLVKILLWSRGGWKLHLGGPGKIGEFIRRVYSARGARRFDVDMMSAAYGRKFQVVVTSANKVPAALRNQLGIAIAKRTYKAARDLLGSPRWQRAYNAGARPQRPLWASTGTKDPQASDVLYVKALAAPLTVNTMPEGTLKALADHGELGAILPADGGDCEEVLAQFAKAGVDVEALASQLQDEGAKAFVKSWHELMEVIVSKSADLGKAG